MSITTKTGDSGQTDLLGGARVSKSDIRIACCGDADELCAALGLAKSLCGAQNIREEIETIQRDLLTLGAELAGGDSARGLTQADVARLEALVARAGEWTGFVLPGADPGSAGLHLARTVCRRLERGMVKANEERALYRPLLLCYTNRLSDALYALAQAVQGGEGRQERSEDA